ncbi:tRNA (guanine(46)-N(7))-methyltransferase TrmB [Glaciecola sp. MF2-115]|uniref:tRNA (guanine(46)-N(7))-methyltransferase TrmB n=1 Tax=Glaciecola sp. MF2-115 TaxID=3384827 RepID=UPI0039A2451E
MEKSPREITTNQTGIHEDLVDIVNKYKHSQFKKPIAQHTQESFDAAVEWLGNWQGDVIIDACCGVGESSLVLSQRYPNAKIIGVDKSVARLDKHSHYKQQAKQSVDDNVRVFQADLNDFWRLMAEQVKVAKWNISKQCVFYPNPYPKKAQVQKRWHASPSFIALLACSKNIEVRSNWLVYLQEFQLALELQGVKSEIAEVSGEPITPFERKYTESGQTCWELQTLADGDDR